MQDGTTYEATANRQTVKDGAAKFCCCACWMHYRFGAPKSITSRSVSDFLSPTWDVSKFLEELRPRELTCVLLYEMLRDRDRYTNLDPPLSKAEQMFIVLAKNTFAEVTNALKLDIDDVESVWTNSGLAIIYMNHEGCSV